MWELSVWELSAPAGTNSESDPGWGENFQNSSRAEQPLSRRCVHINSRPCILINTRPQILLQFLLHRPPTDLIQNLTTADGYVIICVTMAQSVKELDSLLDSVTTEPSFSPPANPQPPVGARPPKIRYTHDAMVDLIIANPEKSQNWIAEQFGYTPAWVSTIFTSDAFQARLAQRRAELVDPALIATIEHKFKAMAHRSAEILMEKLNNPIEKISDQLALQAFQISTRAAGFGVRDIAPPASTTEVHLHLDSLAGRLTGLLSKAKSAEGITFDHPVGDES